MNVVHHRNEIKIKNPKDPTVSAWAYSVYAVRCRFHVMTLTLLLGPHRLDAAAFARLLLDDRVFFLILNFHS